MALELNGTTGVQGNSGAFVAGTAVASTSGTSIDFTSIPSWVKRVTVMFSGVSTNGTSNKLIQLGAGSVTTSGYISTSMVTTTATSSTSGFVLFANTATDLLSGQFVFTLLGSNLWVGSATLKARSDYTLSAGGDVTLGGTLDRVRITTVNGTDAFDAGSINILYE